MRHSGPAAGRVWAWRSLEERSEGSLVVSVAWHRTTALHGCAPSSDARFLTPQVAAGTVVRQRIEAMLDVEASRVQSHEDERLLREQLEAAHEGRAADARAARVRI